MSKVKRVYVEKKQPYAVTAKELTEDIKGYLEIDGLKEVRVLVRYDVENLSEDTYKKALTSVFSEPPVDDVYEETFPYDEANSKVFSVEMCIRDRDKVKYHAAAAIASNLVVGLIDLSEKLLMECGFERDEAGDALAPIVWGNIKHILNNGVVEALTGPIERGDADTIKKHLATISGNDRETYIAVSRQVLEVAKRKNKDRDYSKIEEILK